MKNENNIRISGGAAVKDARPRRAPALAKSRALALRLSLALILPATLFTDPAHAAAPTAAAYTGVSAGALTANWTPDPLDASGTVYEAQLSDTADFSGAVLTSATVNNFADFSGLLPNTTYYGQVRVQSPVSGYTPLGLAFLPPEAPGPAPATLVQHAALTANWTTGANPADTVYEAVLSNTPGFDAGTVSTITTSNAWATFAGLASGTPYYLKVRALDRFGAPTAFTALATTATRAAAPSAGGTPDYLNYPNYATSPLPVVVGGIPTGGIRKFIDTLPGLGLANANNRGLFIPIATKDILTYPDADYYQIGVTDFVQQLHPDLPATKLRGYKDLGGGDGVGRYLGPLIIAQKNRPVRIKFTNNLAPGTAGDLFLPVDTTLMGAGLGPDGVNSYPQNRANIHLHGGDAPWISDGTPHQWITPAAETSVYKRGASQQNVPDMLDPGPGSATYYYPNRQSSRLMWYHDHSHGLTRLNAYAGEAAAYLLTDPAEETLIGAALPDLGGEHHYGIPLIVQDKTFVPPVDQLAAQDPTWDTAKYGGPGSLWFPHVYVPAETADPLVSNPLGRWSYGPWATPPFSVVNTPGVTPNLPNPSVVPETFFDTMLVNGVPYPRLPVTRRAYRFRILNAANDRTMNLQLYYADPANPTEVRMVPAAITAGFPASWPTDGREGGVPDPALAGPPLIQIGTEGGLLPAPAVLPNQPIDFDAVTGNISAKTLLLAPAERADIVIDFSQVPDGSKLILYNDAPAPGQDPRYDFYTGKPDHTLSGGTPTTLPGYGPNTRTVMQFDVAVGGAVAPAFDVGNLTTALAAAFAASEVKPVPAAVTLALNDETAAFTAQDTALPVSVPVQRKTVDETYEGDFGRLRSSLGVQTGPGAAAPAVQFGFVDPATEIVKNGELQVWRLKNYTGDIHPIHFHLFNVQIVNRIDANGAIVPPDANELGWKETVRINPGEDAIVALRPKTPVVPFQLPDSVRYLDPTIAPNSPMGFSMTGPLGTPVAVTNVVANFGHEYVWHCHILGHEENDFMRPLIFQAAPASPGAVAVTPGNGVAVVAFSTGPTGGSPITNYTVTAAGPGGPFTATGPASPITVPGLTNGVAYTFTVTADNAVGTSISTAAPAPVAPQAAPVASPYTGVLPGAVTVNWTGFGDPAGTVYEVQLSTYADFSAALTSATLAASADFTGLLPNTTYYGQVRVQSPVTAYTPLGLVFLPPEAPGPAAATLVQHAALTANWTTGANPADTVYEAVLSNTPGFAAGTVSTITTSNAWATFAGLASGTPYYLKVRALDRFGAPTGFTALATTATRAAAPSAGGTPDYLNYPNYATSPLPVVVGGVPTGGIRKFVDTLPGLGLANANNRGLFIPVATKDVVTYPGSDYYELSLADYTQQLHPDLPATKLRGYKDVKGDGVGRYLGPFIIAQRNTPVRIKFTNNLAPGTAGDLFLPVDTTLMGAGLGPDGVNSFPQNRALLHLHGGDTPWISDGSPHQWITPAAETSVYKRGASAQNVPDMLDPGPGSVTYFYPNQQSARLMWFHDHSHGLTRLNVYAGEAAGYLITEPAEEALITAALPNIPGEHHYGIPLVLQDKTFVPPAAQLQAQDPTWDTAKWGGPGSVWFPHVYVPAETADPLVSNPLGRWSYGPWANPPFTVVNTPGVTPNLPNPSVVPEAFFDTMVVNGVPYPRLPVTRRGVYRFRILNAANDRTMNLQLYYADPANPTEVKMVPAPDGREGGIPDPATAGPDLIQIGTEGGFLPAPAVLPNQPIAFDTVTGNISAKTLLLAPAERADILIDFSGVPLGSKLILYNDAPAPGQDPRYDFYTGKPDHTLSGGTPTTLPGYGPNTRTVMQFEVDPAATADTALNMGTLTSALATAFAASDVKPVPAAVSLALNDETAAFTAQDTALPVSVPVQRKTVDETYEGDFGRLRSSLGVQTGPGAAAPAVQFGYVDPATEIVKNGELQVWRLKNYTGDIHPIHFHLFNVQLINRIDANGAVVAPDANETGWKETLRINPGEDAIVALRPKKPVVPFQLPDSVRYLDPTIAPNSPMGFSMTGPLGTPVAVTNVVANFGHEYVWHCHILGHEENDFMRPLIFQAAPASPGAVTVTPGNGVAVVAFSTGPTGGSPITNYTVTAAGPGGPFTATGSASPITVPGLTNGVAYTFTVTADNAVGTSISTAAPAAVAPQAAPVASTAPYTGVTPGGVTVNWNGFGNPPGTVYEVRLSTAADFSGVVFTSATANASALFQGLGGNATYYAQVRVLSPATAYTPLGELYLPSTLTLLNPDVDAISSTTLRADWDFTPGTLYDAVLAADSGFVTVLSSETLYGGARTYTGLAGDEDYYFAVKVSSEANASFAANTYRKETLPPATALLPVLTASSHSVTAVWQPGFAGAAYKAALSANGLFSMILSSGTEAGLTKTYYGLAPGQNYYFRVKVSTETDFSYSFSSASIRTLTTVTALTPVITAVSSTSISAQWPSAPGVSCDDVLALDSGLTAIVSSGTGTGGTAVYTGLDPATDYYFGVKLSSEAAAAYTGSVAAVRTGTALTPLAPALTALSSTTMSAAWAAGAGPYVVALAADSAFTSIISTGTQAGATASFSALGGGRVYYLAVKVSTEADAAYAFNSVSAPTLPGDTPLAPSLTVVSSNSILAAWTGGSAGAGYVAVLGADAAFTALVSSSAVGGTSMLYGGLSGGREYFFKVKLSSETDASYAINSVSALTSPTITPVSPALTALSSTTLRASWAGCGPGCVAVLASDAGFAAVLSSTTETGASKDFAGLSPDTAYYFKVKLSTEADASYAVNALSALTLHPVTVLAPAFTEISTTALTASWTPVPGATYVVVLAADSGCTSVISSGTQTGASVTYGGLSHYTGYHLQVKLSTETDDSYPFNRASAATAAGEMALNRVWPSKAVWKAGGVDLNAAGTWFVPGTTVKLTRPGHADVPMTGVSVLSPTQLGFKLGQSCAIGRWDLTVSGAGRTTVLPGAFTLLAAPPGSAKVFQGVFKPKGGESAQLATSLLAAGNVSIKVYDGSGRFVREIFDGVRAAGDYLDEWDGRNGAGAMCASGVYLIRFECPGFTTTKRVVMVK